MEVFETDDYLLIDSCNYNESREDFINRMYFIIRNFNENNYIKLKNISYIFLNKFYKGNEYNKKTIENLEKYDIKII